MKTHFFSKRDIALFVFSIVIAQTIIAQDAPKGAIISKSPEKIGKTYAIILGVSEYEELPKLNYADRDAIVFYNYLKAHTLPSDSNNLFLLTNKNVINDNIYAKLYEIESKVKEGDKVFFFFSGHGDMEHQIETDKTLLLLSKSPAKNYLRKSIGFLDIDMVKPFFKVFTEKNAKVIFICDACRAGNLIGGEEGRRNTLLGLQQSWNNEIKILSCQGDEVSLESSKWGGGRGLFSYYFILGLKGLADYDHNNLIVLRELDRYLKEQVGVSSKQTQIPVIYGDFKTVITTSNENSIGEARKELKNNTSIIADDVASRGNTASIEDSLDKNSLILAAAIKKKIEFGELIEPEETSAYDIFKRLERINKEPQLISSSRLELIVNLKSSFNNLLDYFYNDQYEKFGLLEKYKIEKELIACLDLAGNNPAIRNKVKASLLFLDACEIAIGIRPENMQLYSKEKLRAGIDKLLEAISLDSFSPFLYLRLGDYYMYTNQIDKSINAYLIYQKMLPNDEYSYNKLGLAYAAKGQRNLAEAAFRKAIQINPNFWQAAEHLKMLLRK